MFRAKSSAMITSTMPVDFNGLKLSPKTKIFKIVFYNSDAKSKLKQLNKWLDFQKC